MKTVTLPLTEFLSIREIFNYINEYIKYIRQHIINANNVAPVTECLIM